MQLLRHSLMYLFARGIPGIVSVLSLAVFTRLLAPESFGVLVLILATADIMDAVLLQWLYWSLVRFAPGGEHPQEGYYGTILAAFAGTLVPAAIVAVIANLVTTVEIPFVYLAVGFGYFAANGWFEINLQRARADLKPGRFALLDMTRAVLSLALAVGALLMGWGIAGLLGGYILGRIAPTLPLLRGPWRGVRFWKPERPLARRLLRFGLPLGVSMALAVVVNFSDRLLLGALVGTEATGLYGAGYDITWKGMLAVMAVINLAGYPLVTRALERGGREEALERLREYVVIFLVTAGLVATAYAVLARDLAELLLGEAFRATATALIPWAALAIFFSGLRSFYANYAFHLGERTELQIGVSLVPAVLNILLNLLWIPTHGPMGAIWASVISFALGLLLSVAVGARVFALPWPVTGILKGAVVVGSWGGVLAMSAVWGGDALALGMRILAGAAVAGALAIAVNLLDVRGSLERRLAKDRRGDEE